MTCRIAFIAALAALALAACERTAPAPEAAATPARAPAAVPASGKVLVVAEVTSFHAQGMADDFADGTSRAYDLTVLTVREPAALAGKAVRVMHDEPAPEGSVWRRVGARHTFEVDREAIGNDAVTVNAAAVEMVSPSR